MTAETSIKRSESQVDRWLDKAVVPWWPGLTIERLLVVLIIVLTIVTRLYDVGARTMAHDEINHVVPAYTIETYVYDPVTHGPFQFHALALSYFLFGDSDFSARIPAAVFGIAVVIFALLAWRRYLGRVGALIAGTLFMISPYILFYSRYTRNEIFIVFWGVVMLWLFLRYMEDGKPRWLYWLTFITALHYTDKATSYIFSAEALVFLALLFIFQTLRKPWHDEKMKSNFRLAVVVTLLLVALTLGVYMLGKTPAASQGGVDPAQLETQNFLVNSRLPLVIAGVLTAAAVVVTLFFLVKGYGWPAIRKSRVFDLVALQLILILPLMVALPLRVLGFDPTDYSQVGILRSGVTFVILAALSIFLGMLWNRKIFPRCLAIFWGIFIVLYTTFFSQGVGFFKGIVGALGYWMSQQAEQRGTQPLYFYALVQIPMYEYLPALGTIAALIIGIRRKLFFSKVGEPYTAPITVHPLSEEAEATLEAADLGGQPPAQPTPDEMFELEREVIEEEQAEIAAAPLSVTFEDTPGEPTVEIAAQKRGIFANLFTDPEPDERPAEKVPTLLLLLYWSLISLAAFTIAGERMPWLTTHITMPMILSTAFGLGYLLERTDWAYLKQKKGWLAAILTIVFLVAATKLIGSLLGTNPPFQGKDLVNLQGTSNFLLALIGTLGSGIGLFSLLKRWHFGKFARFALLVFFALLAVQTGRTAYRAAYINYDNAMELLVYAHATRDMKDSVEQIETISNRLYGDKSIRVAYDNQVLYPYWWYMRDYPNKNFFDANVSKSLQEYPIIVVGSAQYAKIEPVVREDYYEYDLKRMWWPNEELYRNLSVKRVVDDLTDPAKRSALWELWFNRDYTQYTAAFNNPSLTLSSWSPSDTARMYIRKDVAAQIWELGVSPEPSEPRVDPYASNTISLEPERVISVGGELPFSAPRGMAAAPDGSLFVADSRNHRIVHMDSTGLFLNAWGSYGSTMDDPNVSGGLLNEPWGVAVGPDGLVYVADTWNHRIQVFTAQGEFLRMWSSFEVNGMLDGFWGPRGIAVDQDGRVFVTDTGKQRVVVFDSVGHYLAQFGGLGLEAGQLDEPVGIAVAPDGRVFVADTWNYRVQVYRPDVSGQAWLPEASWEVDAWMSDTVENKPFLALDANNHVFITDPDLGRVIEFTDTGEFVQLWGGYDNSYLMGVISGITAGAEGEMWVSDATNNVLLLFMPPAAP